MSINNAKLLRDLDRIAKQVKRNLNYEDLSLQASKEGVLRAVDGECISDAFKMWVYSTSTDYIRQVGVSGFFTNGLREYTFNDTSIPLIKKDLLDSANVMFPQIDIVELDIWRNESKREWLVRMTIQDTITGMFSDLGSHAIDLE